MTDPFINSYNHIDSELLLKIQTQYSIDKIHQTLLLGDNENIVMNLSTNIGDYILRLKREWHRSVEEVDAEMAYIKLLWTNWAAVVKIVESSQWRLFEELEHNWEKLLISIFEKAAGSGQESDLMNWRSENLLTNLWKSVWKIHSIVENNFGQIGKLHRKHRLDDDIIKNLSTYIINDEKLIFEIESIVNECKLIDESINKIWLIHTDIRPRNQNQIENNVIIYDFDDLTFHYYLYDIAVTLFHSIEWISDEKERDAYAKRFFETYIKWYLSEFPTEINAVELMKLMKLRCAYAIIDYHKKQKFNIKKTEKMNNRRSFIENKQILFNIN